MAVHIALLRAVNLGPHGKVAMADLKKLAGDLGLEDPRTLLVSGNLVFRSRKAAAALERSLEDALRERLGLATKVLVRSSEEWRELVAKNPFVKEAKEDPSHLLAVVTKDPPTKEHVAAIEEAIAASGGRERVKAGARHLYLVYPDGIGRSKLTIQLVERRLGAKARAGASTGRNWNTVLKIAALAEDVEKVQR